MFFEVASFMLEKPAIAPPVFVFQKEKGQKRSAGGSSPEGGEDSDREDGNYCPPVKRERTSSLTQFPPSQSGLPSQKPKEQQRSVLRPAVLQAPQPKALSQTVPSSGTNGVSIPADCTGPATSTSPDNPARRSPSDEARAPEEKEPQRNESSNTSEEENCEKKEQVAQQAFVFGQNLRDRVKLIDESAEAADLENAGHPSSETPTATNYFLQYISSRADPSGPVALGCLCDPPGSAAAVTAPLLCSLENSTNSADTASNKFVFGQNMSERVLSPPKLNELGSDANRENSAAESGSESSSQEATPEKESLAESAAAYTKATARKCLLEKVEVITGEEAESNVLQIQCKLFVFDKTSQSWVERGRGLLRLNDMASADDGTLQSRLGELAGAPQRGPGGCEFPGHGGQGPDSALHPASRKQVPTGEPRTHTHSPRAACPRGSSRWPLPDPALPQCGSGKSREWFLTRFLISQVPVV
nr:PREDICTED: ran-binding protein 3 isoform X2 [Equus przewalskii]